MAFSFFTKVKISTTRLIANILMDEIKYNTLSEVLFAYDVKGQRFEYHDYMAALCSLPDGEQAKPEVHYECTAFKLQPNDSDHTFGGYFGPQVTMADAQGNPVYIPALSDITPDAVLYWEQRYKTATNPLMRMRYAALVWDFKKRIVNADYDKDLYRVYVDSMLEVCNNDLESHPVVTTTVLERLFSIAKGNPADLAKTKYALRDFEARKATDKTVRLWACQFLLMTENKKCFTQVEIDTLVAAHEDRLKRLTTPDANGKIDVWTVDAQCNLLAGYYHSCLQKCEVRRVLKVLEQAHKQCFDPNNPLQSMSILEQLHHKYAHFGLKEDADRLTAEIQAMGTLASQALQQHKYEFEIPKEIFDQADELFGTRAPSDEVRWSNFIFQFIPCKAEEEKSLAEAAKYSPLTYMTATNLLDFKGRPQSVIGSYDKDPEGNLVMYITEHLNFSTHLLGIAIAKMREAGLMIPNRIMTDIIEPCPLYEKSSYSIIRQALDFLFDDQPVLACHLLVPQIECAIRNLVENAGFSVIKPQRRAEKGFQLITLDDLLRKEPVAKAFTPDGALYLRLVLTDQRSLNIRNDICHSILPPDHFHSGVAARLLHVLVMIGWLRIKDVSVSK